MEQIKDINEFNFDTVRVELPPYVIAFTFNSMSDSLNELSFGEGHTHNFYEAHYVLEGTEKITVNNKEYSLHEGDLLIISPQTDHFRMKNGSKVVKTCFKFRIVKSNKNNTTYLDNEEIKTILEYFNSNQYCLINNTDISYMIKMLRESVDSKQIFNKNSQKCLVELLLMEIIRGAQTEIKYSDNLLIDNDENREKVIEHSMEKNIGNEDFSIEDLAKILNVSIRQLSRLFNKFYEYKFTEVLHGKRISKAKHELVYTDKKIKDISEDCGFVNMAYFYKVFKKQTGLAPGEYRKSYLEKIKDS